MKTPCHYLFLTSYLLLISSIAFASDSQVSSYISSESFSNILPIKQLIEDDWQQAPAKDSSKGFTQNEIGLKANWHNFSLNIAHRLDYFVFTNNDTAQTFYLERTDKPLTTQEQYQVSLKLHHQESNGVRLGYQWQFDNFTTEVNLGYWDVSAARESKITGEIYGDNNNNITGIAQLNEFYSNKNFLKRDNYNRWDIDGYGITLDLAMHWQINTKLNMSLDVKDLFSDYTMKNLGYSQGKVDTDGTFINTLGGTSYLPLYRGIETSKDYHFNLPEQINFLTKYQGSQLTKESLAISYLARYKRQGEVNFYYAGIELGFETNSLAIMLDIEHLSPEIQLTSQWFNMTFAIDKLDFNKAMQFTLAMSLNYHF